MFDEYLKFLDLNLVPKGPPKDHLGRLFFMILGGEKAYKTQHI